MIADRSELNRADRIICATLDGLIHEAGAVGDAALSADDDLRWPPKTNLKEVVNNSFRSEIHCTHTLQTVGTVGSKRGKRNTACIYNILHTHTLRHIYTPTHTHAQVRAHIHAPTNTPTHIYHRRPVRPTHTHTHTCAHTYTHEYDHIRLYRAIIYVCIIQLCMHACTTHIMADGNLVHVACIAASL